MFKNNSLGYSVGPSITWNLFNYGRITNSIRVEDARFQQLAVDYENTVLQAVQEVEDAMIAFLRTQEQVAFLTEAVKAYKNSVDLSTLQYKEGLVDFQRVLDAQQNLVQQQDNLVATTGDVGLSLISLYKALGGGWEMRAGQDFVPRRHQRQRWKSAPTGVICCRPMSWNTRRLKTSTVYLTGRTGKSNWIRLRIQSYSLLVIGYPP